MQELSCVEIKKILKRYEESLTGSLALMSEEGGGKIATINIDCRSPVASIYKFNKALGLLNEYWYGKEAEDLLNTYGILNTLRSAGLASEEEMQQNQIKDFMDIEWLYVTRSFTDIDTFRQEIADYVNTHQLKNRLPNYVYIDDLDSWERYLILKNRFENINIILMYKDTDKEELYNSRGKILDVDIDDSTLVIDAEYKPYREAIANLDITNKYKRCLACAKEIIREVSEGKNKIAIMCSLTEELASIMCYVYNDPVGRRARIVTNNNLGSSLYFLSILSKYREAEWDLPEFRYNNRDVRGLKVHLCGGKPKLIYIIKEVSEMKVDGVSLDSYEKYLESNQDLSFIPMEEHRILSKIGKVKFSSVYEYFGLDDLDLDSESYSKHNAESFQKLNKICKEKLVPLLSLLERIGKGSEEENFTTMRQIGIIKIGEHKIIGKIELDVKYEGVEVRVCDKVLPDKAELVKVSARDLYDLDLIYNYDEFVQSKYYKDTLALLNKNAAKELNFSLNQSRREVRNDLSLLYSLSRSAESSLGNVLNNAFNIKLADPILKFDIPFIKERMLKHISLHGVRTAEIDRMCISVFGGLNYTLGENTVNSQVKLNYTDFNKILK